MACLLVPAAEAVVTTVVTKIMESREKEGRSVQIHLDHADTVEAAEKIKFSDKMKWLNKLLWGGSALLAFEHMWHGEIVPYFPFLTAAGNPADTAEMLGEMSTVGVGMAVLVTVVWAGMVVASNIIEKKTEQEVSPAPIK